MTILLEPVSRFAARRHHPATAALLVLAAWSAAAAVVGAIHLLTASPAAQTAGTIATIVLTALCYMNVAAREAGSTHALGVGIAWLVLSIATEIALTAWYHAGWFSLIGSPDHPLLRNACLFVWIFAPVAFARRPERAEPDGSRPAEW